jgi:hypothetical protein
MSDELIKTQSLTPEQIRELVTFAPDFSTSYSNYVRVASSAMDFRIFFGQSYPTAKAEMIVVENFCVVLHPEQARKLRDLLSSLLPKTAEEEPQAPAKEAETTH